MTPTFEKFALADQFVTAKGAKVCVLSSDGAPVRVIQTAPIRIPFEPGNFDKSSTATRLSLVMCCSPEMEEYFDALDAWAVEYLTIHSERLFKKPMTKAQIQGGYKSAVVRKGGYPAQVRAKINTEGKNACEYWASDGSSRGPPSDWRGVEYIPSLTTRQLWQMGADFGWVIEVTDLLVIEPERRSPFADIKEGLCVAAC